MVRVLHNNTPSDAPKGTHPSREVGLFFRVSVALPNFEPWSIAMHLTRPGEAVTRWARDDKAFAAIGSVAERCFEGKNRFAEADDWTQAFRQSLLGPCGSMDLAGVPLFIGGFSFSDEMSPALDGPWMGWVPGILRVPRLVLYTENDRCVAILTERLKVGQNPSGRKEALREELHEAMSRPLGMPLPQPAGLDVDTCDGVLERDFRSAVDAALDSFADTSADAPLSKVVVSRRARYVASGQFAPNTALLRLRERFRECTTFSFEDPFGRHFLGATPELLVRKRGVHAQTRALAGTVRVDSPCGPENLLKSNKDQREHAFVVRAIEDALRGVATSVTSEDEPHLRTLRHMVHLETSIEAALRPSVTLVQALACLHPTPAVGGFPRKQAIQFLSRHERSERGWYAGPIGWIDEEGDGEFHVALRCGVMDGRNAWAFAGAGIVEGSDADAEWSETETKLGPFYGAMCDKVGPA
jgi:isochorismate synthase